MAEIIRIGQRADVGQLRAVELAASRLFPAERIPEPSQTYPEAEFIRAADQGLLFVADVAGELVGFAVCCCMDERLHLEEVSVHPDHGRKGYGRALVVRVIEAASERNLPTVSLTTFADLPWNGPFYASMGFRPVPESDLVGALAEAIAHEQALGMTERIAMIYECDPTSAPAP